MYAVNDMQCANRFPFECPCPIGQVQTYKRFVTDAHVMASRSRCDIFNAPGWGGVPFDVGVGKEQLCWRIDTRISPRMVQEWPRC